MKLDKARYIPTIGLEVHIQLDTVTKLFCADTTEFDAEPNTQISEVSLAYPGALPVLNAKAVDYAVKLGAAIGSDFSRYMIFDRKNYFYPDLPKGYQITQDTTPICLGGRIPIRRENGELFYIQLNRVHIEEDAGKSIHADSGNYSYIDYNRAGVVLLEMVTEPVICSSKDASLFLQEVRRLVRFLGIADGNMGEGSLRCDANISIRREDEEKLGSKVEIKNLNSFKFVQKAIEYEIKRQQELLQKGEGIDSETRLYDSVRNITVGMRSKETLNDYRYFPDPDLSPVVLSEEKIDRIKAEIDVVPWELEDQLSATGELSYQDISLIASDLEIYHYFKRLIEFDVSLKQAANWIAGPIKTYLNKEKSAIANFPIVPETLAVLIKAVENKDIPYKIASSELWEKLLSEPNSKVENLVSRYKQQIEGQGDDLEEIILKIAQENKKEFTAMKNGKKKLVGLFMGLIMKAVDGKVDPAKAREILFKIEL